MHYSKIILVAVFMYSILGSMFGFPRKQLPILSKVVGRLNSSGRKSSAVQQGIVASDTGDRTDPSGLSATGPPKGTRDFYPDALHLRNWLHATWRETSCSFGFEEYDAPVLESEELYVRKAGEEITEQLYNFVDKGGRRVSLRPEMTPSLARMVLSKGNSLPLPFKWFSVPQCWRYERMSKGRRREHFQWNMDIWGVVGVEAEAELVAAVVAAFRALGLSSGDVVIKLSNRKLLNEVLGFTGVPPELWAAACIVVDKADKLPLAEVERQLGDVGLKPDAAASLLQLLAVRSLDDLEGRLAGPSAGVAELRRLLTLLGEGYGVSDWVQFDFSVVRGLAYYTGTVFEAADRAGKLRAICGGGRYDNLFQALGGQKAIPAVGFGFGDAVVMELLGDLGKLPALHHSSADVVVTVWDEGLRVRAMSVAAGLRAGGTRVDLFLEPNVKIKTALQRADKGGAQVMVMLAPDEHSAGQAVVRDLRRRDQSAVPYEQIAAHVQQLLRLPST